MNGISISSTIQQIILPLINETKENMPINIKVIDIKWILSWYIEWEVDNQEPHVCKE